MSHQNDLNILDLIDKCKSKDQSSCKELYQLYKNSTYATCMRYASSREEAEDWLQEGWIKAFQNIHQFDYEKGRFYSWLSRVIVNNILSHKRKQQIYKEDIDQVMNLSSYEIEGYESLDYKELINIIQKLPNGFRTVFNLYEIEGYSHKEIAEMLNISESTSKTQLMRSKLSLKQMIEESFAEQKVVLSFGK